MNACDLQATVFKNAIKHIDFWLTKKFSGKKIGWIVV